MTDMKKRFIKAINNNMEDVFYKSWTWQKKREEIVDRDCYECQACKALGRVGPGEVVHHMIELKDRPDLGLDSDNLTTLCHPCHNSIHKKGKGTVDPKFINEERW